MRIRSHQWKRLFLILLLLDIAVLAMILFLAVLYPQTETIDKDDGVKRSGAMFTVSTDKKQLTQYVNGYLRKLSSENSKIDYAVVLNDDVELHGELTVLGKKLTFQMNFQAEVQPDGDLLLRQKSIRLGGLRLPVKTVLEVMKSNYAFPDGVTIMPKEQQIYVALTRLKTKSGMTFEAIDFDLKNDKIKLNIYLP